MLQKFIRVSILTAFLCLVAALPISAQSKTVPVQLTIPATTLTLQGYAAPGALVTFIENGSAIGTVAADSSGYFSSLLSSQPTGVRQITAYFTDASNLQSLQTSKSVSVQSHSNTTLEFFLSPTVVKRTTSTNVQRGSLVQIGGYTASGATVTARLLQTGNTFTITAGADGQYEFLIDTSDLNDGIYDISAVSALVGYPSNSEPSDSVSFTVTSESGPTIPDIVVSPQQLPPPIPQTPDDGARIQGNSVVISGESVPDAQIVIYENGQSIGSIFADSSGRWTFVYQASTSPVTLSFEACINGVCSVLSKSLTLYFDRPNVCSVFFELEQYRFSEHSVGSVLELNVLLTSGDGVMNVFWGDSTEEEVFDHSADRPVPLTHSYLRTGRYNGTVIFAQKDCTYTRYFSVEVVDEEKSTAVNLWLVFTVILSLLPFSYIAYEKGKKYTPEEV